MNCGSIMPTPLHMLGVVEIAQGICDARFTAEDVVRACLQRIDAREEAIHAWACVEPQAAIAQSRAALAGPLAGVPFGVKDVIDTAELPTAMGSAVYRSHRSPMDAGCVAQVRMAGAIVLGKTVTAEFAGTQPTRTANPHDTGHTSGGSSSGSAAAVADNMVPFAFGTQTGGSVLRPASFCGVVGFKPTFGSYTTAGVKIAAHSLDTVGVIARSVADIGLVHAVLMNEAPYRTLGLPPRIGLFRSHLWDTVEPATRDALESAIRRLVRCGAVVTEVEPPAGFERITEARAIINAFERARALGGEWMTQRARMAPQSALVSERGFAIGGAEYAAARRAVDDLRGPVAQLISDVDFLLTPTAPGEAPVGKDYAGDPRLQELWTVFQMPALSMPLPRETGRLPLGVQLVGPRFGDGALLTDAQWVERSLRDA